MDISLFSGFEKMVREQNLGVYAAHVYKKGQGSAEIFFRDNERVHLFSGSKAFASVAVGIAEGEGRLSLSDCVLSYFPQYKKIASDGAEKITNQRFAADARRARQATFFNRPRHT